MPKRPRKLKLAPSYSPWACVILAIDPGADSGFALYDHGELLEWGNAHSFGMMRVAAERAHMHAEFIGAPLVIVIESHSVWAGWGAKQREAVIENVGEWKLAIKQLPKRMPVTKTIRVNVSTWRSTVLGKVRAVSKAEVKAVAFAIFKAKLATDIDHNTAEAILIGHWATHAGEVGALPGIHAIAA